MSTFQLERQHVLVYSPGFKWNIPVSRETEVHQFVLDSASPMQNTHILIIVIIIIIVIFPTLPSTYCIHRDQNFLKLHVRGVVGLVSCFSDKQNVLTVSDYLVKQKEKHPNLWKATQCRIFLLIQHVIMSAVALGSLVSFVQKDNSRGERGSSSITPRANERGRLCLLITVCTVACKQEYFFVLSHLNSLMGMFSFSDKDKNLNILCM